MSGFRVVRVGVAGEITEGRVLAKLEFWSGKGQGRGRLRVTCECGTVYTLDNIGEKFAAQCPGCRALLQIDHYEKKEGQR